MPTTVRTNLRAFTDDAQHVIPAIRDVNTNTITTTDGHSGMPHVVPYQAAVGMGLVAGHTHFSGIGRRDSLATTTGGDDISDLAAVAIPWPNQTVGEQMTLVSDNVNDTAAGTGARTVKVHYLTSAGVYAHEVVTLNGTTPVNTVATNIRFVQQITVMTIGVFGTSAAGNITIYKLATPATVYARIVAGNNISLSSARMVPAGSTFFLSSLNISSTSSKAVSVRLTATCDHGGIYTEGVFMFNEIIECQDSTATMLFDVPRKIPPLAIIKGKAVSTLANGSVAISYDGWLEA